MPISPNDPDYKEVMARHREECRKAKKLYGCNRIRKKDLISIDEKEKAEAERQRARNRKRAERARQKRVEEKKAKKAKKSP